MGWIFCAHDDVADRLVAIKMLLPSLAEKSDLRKRFLHEARIQGQLSHPHIVALYDTWSRGEAVAIVLEWIPGENLSALLERIPPPLSIIELWHLMAPILDAMAYAHEMGIIHRDLKPENFLIKWDGDVPIVKITDFGIAKVIDALDERLTKTGAMMGTIKFMSPEQFKDTKRVDLRADVYSLGICLYHMATGGFPYAGNAHQLMFKALAHEPPIPPRLHHEGIDGRLAEVILEAIAAEPERRYQSCIALREALFGLLSEQQQAAFQDATAPHKEAPPAGSRLVPLPDEIEIENVAPARVSETVPYAGDVEGAIPSGSFSDDEAFAQTSSLDADAAAGSELGTEAGVVADVPEGSPKATGSRMGLAWASLGLLLVAGLAWWGLSSSSLPPSARRAVAPAGCQIGASEACYDGPAASAGRGTCRRGQRTCVRGADGQPASWGPCRGSVLPRAKERCDGRDDDCDGQIDEDFPDLGKPCQRRQGRCIDPGHYRCDKRQAKLTCVTKDSGEVHRVWLTILPEDKAFQLTSRDQRGRFRVAATGRFCMSAKSGASAVWIRRRGYVRCRVSFHGAKTKSLVLKMQRRGTFSPGITYCVKKRVRR